MKKTKLKSKSVRRPRSLPIAKFRVGQYICDRWWPDEVGKVISITYKGRDILYEIQWEEGTHQYPPRNFYDQAHSSFLEPYTKKITSKFITPKEKVLQVYPEAAAIIKDLGKNISVTIMVPKAHTFTKKGLGIHAERYAWELAARNLKL